MSDAQRRDRRQRVENIAHCAQTDDEQAEVGLRVQRTIFAQRDRPSKFSFQLPGFSSEQSIFSDFQRSAFGDQFTAILFLLSDLSLDSASFPHREKSSQFL